MLIWPFIFLFFAYLFINFFGWGFFHSFYLAFWCTYAILAMLDGSLSSMFIALLAIALFYIAFAVFNHSKINDVRFGFLFACLTFFFLPIGLVLYLLLWKKMSRKIGKVIKADEGTITFHNNNRSLDRLTKL